MEAKYEYDAQGRLRAEWNPEISPMLRKVYGYDAEGRVTAVSPPGKQPWLLHYGAIVGDSNVGRLLSVTRPSALNGALEWQSADEHLRADSVQHKPCDRDDAESIQQWHLG